MGLFNNLRSDTSQDYTSAYGQAQSLAAKGKDLANQYAGNAGYNNAINQGLRGAAVTAGQAGQQATQAARNAGMAKGRAANLGASQAANAYGSNFQGQQSLATQAGMNALNANQMNANQYSQLANLALNEQQARRSAANQNLQTIGNLLLGGAGLLTGLSDEKCKDIKDKADHISKLVENIDTYLYKYTPEAQAKYSEEADNKEHIGPIAQDLEKNPVTESSVVEDKDGIKHVDTKQLALQTIALVSDLSKRISELEEK